MDHGYGPAQRIAGLNFHDRTDHSRHRQSIQHHSCLLAPVLSVAATSCLHRIGNFDSLHASPMVAVRETVPRRSARYRASVNNDSEPALCVRVNRQNKPKIIRHDATQWHRGNRPVLDRTRLKENAMNYADRKRGWPLAHPKCRARPLGSVLLTSCPGLAVRPNRWRKAA
jgi:hypothetical protein